MRGRGRNESVDPAGTSSKRRKKKRAGANSSSSRRVADEKSEEKAGDGGVGEDVGVAVREDKEKSKSTCGSSPRGNLVVESEQSEGECEDEEFVGEESASDGVSDSGSEYNGE